MWFGRGAGALAAAALLAGAAIQSLPSAQAAGLAGTNGITIQSIRGVSVPGFFAQGGDDSGTVWWFDPNEAMHTASSTPDGRYTALTSGADDLVAGDSNASSDVLLRDNFTGAVTRITAKRADGTQPDDDSFQPSISTDGRYVAFVTWADGFASDDDNFGGGDVYVYDRVAKTYTHASVTNSGVPTDATQDDGSDYVTGAAMSGNAAVVAFTTDDNEANGDTNMDYDVYVRDLVHKATYRISGPTNGGGGVDGVAPPAVSGNGCTVAFASSAGDIDARVDTRNGSDIFIVPNTCTAGVLRPPSRATVTPSNAVSTCQNGTAVPPAPPNSKWCNIEPALNAGIGFIAGGRYVAWSSIATDLVTSPPAAVDGVHHQIYVRDMSTGITTLVTTGNGDSRAPSLSPDGCNVAFSSSATDLIGAGNDTNGKTDVFVKHLGNPGCGAATPTVRIGMGLSSQGALVQPDDAAADPQFSPSGQQILFSSAATNLIAAGGDQNGNADVFAQQYGTDTLAPTWLGAAYSGSSLWSLSRTLTPSWSAWDVSGISSYAAEYRRFGWTSATPTAWSPMPNVTSPTPNASTSFTGSAGNTYCVRLAAATDGAVPANTGGTPSSGAACRAIPLTSSSLAYSSGTGWAKQTISTAYAGFGYRTTTHSAYAVRTKVVAKRLALVATTCSACGTVAVQWNGRTIRNINLRSTTTRRQAVITIASFTAPTSGTLKIVVTSTGKPVVIEGLGTSSA